MSEPGRFEPGTLIFSGIYRVPVWFDEMLLEIRRKFGPIAMVSDSYEFPVSYYEKEMGKPLMRRFAVVKGKFEFETLIEAKLWGYGFEVYSSFNGSRGINIDPGIVFASSLVIATFKPFSHRIPLSKGVYAHLELLFSKGIPRPLPWTYPDFASGKYNDFLKEIWKIHRSEKG